MRNALAHAHKGQREMIAAMIRTAFAQPDYDAAVLQWRQVADNLRPKVEKLAALMDAAEADVLAFMTFPKELCHLDYGYAVTIQRAQGATAYPILNAPSYRVNTIHLTSAYVGVSRAPGAPFIVTDSRVRLIRSLGERVGLQSAALDQARETAGLAEQVVRDLATQRHLSADMEPAAQIQRLLERGGRSIER